MRTGEVLMPTAADIRWVCQHIGGRHTGGFEAWWEQNCAALSLQELAEVVIAVWEAGRPLRSKIERT